MSFFTAFFVLQLKRLLRRPATLICLLAAPVLVLALGMSTPQEEEQAVQVGVFLPENSRYGADIWQSLAASGSPDLRFVQAESEEAAKEKVAAGVWECSYIFPQNVDDRLAEGKYRRLVVRADGPGTSMGSVLDWTVATAILDACAVDLADAVLVRDGVMAQGEQAQYSALAEDLFARKNALKVEVQPIQGGPLPQQSSARLTEASFARGLLALALLLFSCLSSVWFSQDRQSGFFLRLQPHQGVGKLYFPTIAASALLSAGAGFLCIAAASSLFHSQFGGLGREFALVLLYLVPLGSFSFLLAMLFSKWETLACIMPFLLMACLLICPVLLDVSNFVPGLKPLAALLPPTPYLWAASGVSKWWWMLLQAAFYAGLGLLAGRRRKKA